MTFKQALREWGARQLDANDVSGRSYNVDRTTVTVEWSSEITSDCDTCGPSSEMTIEISGRVPNDGVRYRTVYGYGMAALVRDLDAIASEPVSS